MDPSYKFNRESRRFTKKLVTPGHTPSSLTTRTPNPSSYFTFFLLDPSVYSKCNRILLFSLCNTIHMYATITHFTRSPKFLGDKKIFVENKKESNFHSVTPWQGVNRNTQYPGKWLVSVSVSKSYQLSSRLSTINSWLITVNNTMVFVSLINSWLIGQNPDQQSIDDNELIVDKVVLTVLIIKETYLSH